MRSKTPLLAASVFLALLWNDQSTGVWAGPSESNPSRCSDGRDNDGDGDIDCQDSGCNGRASCEFGTEASCSDGFDNDGDGAVDGADSDCGPLCVPTETPETSCFDGFDNDCDGDIDGADSDCGSSCTPTETPEASCSDGADNDCDGDIDGDDSDCAPSCTPTESPESSCSDGIDNDCDGDTDGADSNCGSSGTTTGSCIPGFEYAVFSDGRTEWSGTPDVDSWDSGSGSYASTRTCGSADVGTNSTTAGDFSVSGSPVICGDGVVGAGGDPATVITGGGTITGSRQALGERIELQDVSVPGLPNGSPFSPSGRNVVLTPNRTYGALSCSGGPGSAIELQGGTYVVESISLSGQCSIEVTDGPISVYFTDSLNLGGGSVSNSTGIPSNLIFYGGPSASNVTMRGNSSAYFAVYAPQAHCDVAGTADIFGAVVCGTSTMRGTGALHYDRALSEFEGGGFSCEVEEEGGREVSRSNPIFATIDGTQELLFQGSFEAPDGAAPVFNGLDEFSFPHVKGHLRAIDATSVSTSGTLLNDDALTVAFDAASQIPAATASGCSTYFTSSCRTVFSHTTSTGSPFVDKVFLETGGAERDALKQYLDPSSSWDDSEVDILISRILAGDDVGGSYRPALGGIDWSTMAIVKPSNLAGSSTRPTMIYAGGLDGMLHAFCAEGGVGACDTAGQELWAFVPRTQLPLLQTNNGRIDGSPTVSDVFGDADGDERKEFRTVLTFQTGSGTGGDANSPPAVYALDITDPASPNILWEVVTPGAGVDTTMGIVEGGDAATFIQSSTGSSGNAGSYLASIDTNTGALNWSHTYTYPAPRSGSERVPNTALPGGVALVDKAGQNAISHLVVPGLFGEVFILNAKDGSNDYGADVPAVRFSSDFNPVGVAPTIYADQATGTLHAVVVTGGYADSTSATLWAPDAVGQFAVSFPLEIPVGSAPIDEGDALIDFKIDFEAGQRAFASAIVAGNELFIVTDSSNVNASDYGTSATGLLSRYNVSTGAAIGFSAPVAGGAGSPAISTDAGVAYSGSAGAAQSVTFDDFDAAGTSVDLSALAPLARRLFWLSL